MRATAALTDGTWWERVVVVGSRNGGAEATVEFFALNQQEIQETWGQSLMGWRRFSRHQAMIVCGNAFCLIGLMNLGKFAMAHGVNLALVSSVLALMVVLMALAGYYMAQLVKRTRALLNREVLVAHAESEVLAISYLGFKLYECALFGMGCVAMVMPAFFNF